MANALRRETAVKDSSMWSLSRINNSYGSRVDAAALQPLTPLDLPSSLAEKSLKRRCEPLGRELQEMDHRSRHNEEPGHNGLGSVRSTSVVKSSV